MGVSNFKGADTAPAAPPKPQTPGYDINLAVGSFGYDSSGKPGTRNKGFAFFSSDWEAAKQQAGMGEAGQLTGISRNVVMQQAGVNRPTAGTVAYLGEADEGTDITKMIGQGRAVRPEWANYAQYMGVKIESEGAGKHAARSGDALVRFVEETNPNLVNNPWGKGPDAAAAALEFERRFMANDQLALREMTDLQRREYGAVYGIKGSTVDRYTDIGTFAGDDSWEARQAQRDSRNNPREKQKFRYIAPTSDLSAIEQYKLLRYEMRDIQTNRAVGSGYDPDYNPLGLIEDDRFTPGEFVQDEARYAPMRVAGREARQSGKKNLTATDTKSVQL